jgi:hypothetical protein
VLDGDLVAEEGRRLGAGVRDQRLVLVECQLEVITQDLCEALLDLLGFGLARSRVPFAVESRHRHDGCYCYEYRDLV